MVTIVVTKRPWTTLLLQVNMQEITTENNYVCISVMKGEQERRSGRECQSEIQCSRQASDSRKFRGAGHGAPRGRRASRSAGAGANVSRRSVHVKPRIRGYFVALERHALCSVNVCETRIFLFIIFIEFLAIRRKNPMRRNAKIEC